MKNHPPHPVIAQAGRPGIHSQITAYLASLTFFIITFLLSNCAHAASSNLTLWYTKPAGPWEEALPLGSGRLGAMVFGIPVDEHIQFNEDTLWKGQPHDYVRAGAGEQLTVIRDLLAAGNVTNAAVPTRHESY